MGYTVRLVVEALGKHFGKVGHERLLNELAVQLGDPVD